MASDGPFNPYAPPAEAPAPAFGSGSSRSRMASQLLSLGDLFSWGWGTFSRNYKALIGISVIVYAPLNLILSYVPQEITEEGGLGDLKLYFRAAQCLESLFGVVATLAAIHLFDRDLAGEPQTIGGAMRHAVQRWLRAIGTNILTGLVILLFALLLIVPGIIRAVQYSFVLQSLAVHDLAGQGALDHSRALVEGRWWRIFGITLLFGLIAGAGGFLLAVGVEFLKMVAPLGRALDVLSFTLIDFIGVYFLAATTVMFLNLDLMHEAARARPELPGVANGAL